MGKSTALSARDKAKIYQCVSQSTSLKIAIARLQQMRKKFCLSLSPVLMRLTLRREFSSRAKAKLVVELLKGRQMVKILLLEKKKLTIVGENFGLPNSSDV